jgi:hypothetical protein
MADAPADIAALVAQGDTATHRFDVAEWYTHGAQNGLTPAAGAAPPGERGPEDAAERHMERLRGQLATRRMERAGLDSAAGLFGLRGLAECGWGNSEFRARHFAAAAKLWRSPENLGALEAALDRAALAEGISTGREELRGFLTSTMSAWVRSGAAQETAYSGGGAASDDIGPHVRRLNGRLIAVALEEVRGDPGRYARGKGGARDVRAGFNGFGDPDRGCALGSYPEGTPSPAAPRACLTEQRRAEIFTSVGMPKGAGPSGAAAKSLAASVAGRCGLGTRSEVDSWSAADDARYAGRADEDGMRIDTTDVTDPRFFRTAKYEGGARPTESEYQRQIFDYHRRRAAPGGGGFKSHYVSPLTNLRGGDEDDLTRRGDWEREQGLAFGVPRARGGFAGNTRPLVAFADAPTPAKYLDDRAGQLGTAVSSGCTKEWYAAAKKRGEIY